MLGLKRGIVEVHPYTPIWKDLFAAEKERLEAAIGQHVLAIEHIGSTAIPGLAAKPIIDIGAAVQNFEAARVCIKPIEQLGYEYRGENGIPRRHYFSKGEPCTHHLHMNEIDSHDWQITIRFRDYLIAHPDLAQEYAALKLRLAQQFKQDRPAYLAGKAAFIEHILQLAEEA